LVDRTSMEGRDRMGKCVEKEEARKALLLEMGSTPRPEWGIERIGKDGKRVEREETRGEEEA
jgi:hypothetical protein